jgi:hypothetical protein
MFIVVCVCACVYLAAVSNRCSFLKLANDAVHKGKDLEEAMIRSGFLPHIYHSQHPRSRVLHLHSDVRKTLCVNMCLLYTIHSWGQGVRQSGKTSYVFREVQRNIQETLELFKTQWEWLRNLYGCHD